MELSMNIYNLTWRYDLARCAEIYQKAGFTAVDYGFFKMGCDDTDPMNGADYRTKAQEMRRTIEAAGLKVNQTHAPFHFQNWGDENYFQTVTHPRLVRSLEISAILGAKIAIVHPLHYGLYHGHEEEWFERNMKFYRSLIPYCREYGIKVALENMWQRHPLRRNIVLDTCAAKEEFVRYVDALDSEYMVACLDLGHVGLSFQYDEAQDVIRALGHDRLQALHVHDNNYQEDQHLLPFMGKMNWAEITRALGEINYSGDFTYEVNRSLFETVDDGFVQTTANYMGALGKHLMGEIERNRKV